MPSKSGTVIVWEARQKLQPIGPYTRTCSHGTDGTMCTLLDEKDLESIIPVRLLT